MAQFQNGHGKVPGSGRRKGTPNKATANIKQAFIDAFEKLGGTAALFTWAKKNPTEFFKLIGKLLPQEIKAELSGEAILKITRVVVTSRTKTEANDLNQRQRPSAPAAG